MRAWEQSFISTRGRETLNDALLRRTVTSAVSHAQMSQNELQACTVAHMTTSEWDIDPRPTSPDDSALTGDWYAVRGISERTEAAGDLLVRVGHSADGRVILTGIAMSGADEISANTLRAIQPAKIVRTIAWREEGGEPPRAVGDVDPITGLARFEGVAMEFEAIAANAPITGDESKRGRRGPSRDDLEQFARVYLGFYRAGKSDPVKQTTRALNISRATAHRRITQARELGLIPPREEEK